MIDLFSLCFLCVYTVSCLFIDDDDDDDELVIDFSLFVRPEVSGE